MAIKMVPLNAFSREALACPRLARNWECHSLHRSRSSRKALPRLGLDPPVAAPARLGGKGHRFRDAHASAPWAILCPDLRQIEACTDRQKQQLARGRISDDVLSADHDLAVPLLAQRSRILMMHAHRSLPSFGQAGVIQQQDAIGRAALHQEAHALFIQGLRIPGGIRQQMLQLFQRGVSHCLGNRLTVLARQIGQHSRELRLVLRRNNGANGFKYAANSGKGSGDPFGKVIVFILLSYHETNRVVLKECTDEIETSIRNY
jgi:hypothetical protein